MRVPAPLTQAPKPVRNIHRYDNGTSHPVEGGGWASGYPPIARAKPPRRYARVPGRGSRVRNRPAAATGYGWRQPVVSAAEPRIIGSDLVGTTAGYECRKRRVNPSTAAPPASSAAPSAVIGPTSLPVSGNSPAVVVVVEASVVVVVEASVEEVVEASVEDVVEASVEEVVEASVEDVVEASVEDVVGSSLVELVGFSVDVVDG